MAIKSIEPKLFSAGFGLTEMMIGVGLISVLALFLTQLTVFQNKSIVGNRTIISRDGVKIMLDRYSRDAGGLNKSLSYPGNDALMACVKTGSAFGTCASPPCCDSTKSYGFILIDPTGANVVSDGTPSGPTRYNPNGAPCASGSATPNCPLEATIYFTPICATGSVCATANSIKINSTLKQGNTTLSSGTHLRDVTTAITIPASYIVSGSQSCPSGQVVIGFDMASGTVTCGVPVYAP